MMSFVRGFVLLQCVVAASFAATLAGVIVDEHTGVPIRRAKIKASALKNSDFIPVATAGDRGDFLISLSDGRSYRIEVSRQNYVTTELTIQTRVMPKSLVIPLTRLGAIGGRVTSLDSQRIVTGRVFALPRSPAAEYNARFFSALEKDGAFRLYNLPPGGYRIAARTETQGSLPSLVYYPDNDRPVSYAVAGGEEERDLNLVFPPRARYRVRGSVQIPEPDRKFLVSLVPTARPELAIAVRVTDTSGSFSFDAIPAGQYTALVTGPIEGIASMGAVLSSQSYFGRTAVDISSGDAVDIAVPVQVAGPSTIRLDIAGGQSSQQCPREVRLILAPAEDWGIVPPAPVSLRWEESMTVGGLPPGDYHVAMSNAQGCALAESTILRLTASQSAAKVPMVAAGSIKGVVTREGRPHADGLVLVRAVSQAGSVTELYVFGTDEQGRFATGPLRAGGYYLAAHLKTDETVLRMENLSKASIATVAPGSISEIELTAKETVAGN